MPVAELEPITPVRPGAVPDELRQRLDALRDRIRSDERLKEPSPREAEPSSAMKPRPAGTGELPESLRRRTAVIVELRDRSGRRAVRWLEGLPSIERELRGVVIEGPDRLLVRAVIGAVDLVEGERATERVFDFVHAVGLLGTPLFRERGLGPPSLAENGAAGKAAEPRRRPARRGKGAQEPQTIFSDLLSRGAA